MTVSHLFWTWKVRHKYVITWSDVNNVKHSISATDLGTQNFIAPTTTLS